ncbi:MAG: 4Fe-4S binding protein [Anaerolineae bacterium]|nr:4Fe-4S binding protein [Anaerolineae bacterium]
MGNDRRATLFRRDFLKLMGLGVGASLVKTPGQALASPAGADEVAILYDASKCLGCRACERACKECNDLPQEPEPPTGLSAITWNLIMQRQGVAANDQPFFNMQCMHCTNAACVAVCPTGALYKDPKGFVAFDEAKCNGCGYCTQFCPFGVPHLKESTTVTTKAGKCIFCCTHQQPSDGPGSVACVEACPTGALTLGWRDNQLETAKARVAQLKADGHSAAMLYGETEAGGLHRLSILLDEPHAYGLPADPQGAVDFSTVWQRVIQPLGGIAVGATAVGLVINWLIARTKIKVEEA